MQPLIAYFTSKFMNSCNCGPHRREGEHHHERRSSSAEIVKGQNCELQRPKKKTSLDFNNQPISCYHSNQILSGESWSHRLSILKARFDLGSQKVMSSTFNKAFSVVCIHTSSCLQLPFLHWKESSTLRLPCWPSGTGSSHCSLKGIVFTLSQRDRLGLQRI